MSKTNETHKIFNIPTHLLNNVHKLLDEHCFTESETDKYDEETTRFTITNDNLLSKIKLLCFYSNETVDLSKSTVHYIKYHIKDSYNIEKHTDQCEKTFIFYLNKEQNIKEHFYIETNPVSGDELWNNGGLIMYKEAEHYGNYIGSGYRDVICVFCG